MYIQYPHTHTVMVVYIFHCFPGMVVPSVLLFFSHFPFMSIKFAFQRLISLTSPQILHLFSRN